ncbi:dihydroneopterin aldolase [Candidatus Neomarinimicrobiota bacterium]
MDIIRLDNIALYAYHGVMKGEQDLGQRFFMDVELFADLTEPAKSDALGQTVDYHRVYKIATDAFTGERCYLLERAAWNVMTALFKEFAVDEITVRIRKPSAPIDGLLDTVELEMTREREEISLG